MLSFGIEEARALRTAVRRRGLELMSPPPILAAIEISFMNFVNICPRLASAIPFACLIVDHLLCPDMGNSSKKNTDCSNYDST